MSRNSVIIIGSGPAGLAAALALSRNKIQPLILERLNRPSLKLLASGGGQCNFSNILAPEDFMLKFGRNGAFMRNALRLAPREKFLDFLHEENVETVLREKFYDFPASSRACDVADAFLRASGAEVRTESEVTAIEAPDGQITGVTLKNRSFIPASFVILAAGGCAWSGLGTMSGLRLAESLGHSIRKPLPAVAPLQTREKWPGTLAGVTLPQARLTLRSGRDTLVTEGSLLFTHTGLSGFPALDIAGEISSLCDRNGSAELRLSVRADMTAAEWEKVFDEARKQNGARSILSILNDFIPRSLAGILTDFCGCAGVRASSLSTESGRKLISCLTGWVLTLTGAGPMEKAMAMRGGVNLKEVDPAAMASRLVSGLYFAGEILDLTGPCGGYNIQWAFSSGYLAGCSAAAAFKSSQGGVSGERINHSHVPPQ